MSNKLPPPITKKSRKSDMWEEVKSLRNEIDQQQEQVNAYRNALHGADSELIQLRYQIGVIRAALAMHVRSGE